MKFRIKWIAILACGCGLSQSIAQEEEPSVTLGPSGDFGREPPDGMFLVPGLACEFTKPGGAVWLRSLFNFDGVGLNELYLSSELDAATATISKIEETAFDANKIFPQHGSGRSANHEFLAFAYHAIGAQEGTIDIIVSVLDGDGNLLKTATIVEGAPTGVIAPKVEISDQGVGTVIYKAGTDIKLQRFNGPTGEKIGDAVTIDSDRTAGTFAYLDAAGDRAVVIYGPFTDVFGKIVDFSEESPVVGDEFRVFETSQGYNPDFAVATNLETGEEFTAVTSRAFEQNQTLARRFDSSGAPQGDAFQVNTTAPLNQIQEPDIAYGPGGVSAISWTCGDKPGNLNILARFYGEDGEAISEELQVTDESGFQMAPVSRFDPRLRDDLGKLELANFWPSTADGDTPLGTGVGYNLAEIKLPLLSGGYAELDEGTFDQTSNHPEQPLVGYGVELDFMGNALVLTRRVEGDNGTIRFVDEAFDDKSGQFPGPSRLFPGRNPARPPLFFGPLDLGGGVSEIQSDHSNNRNFRWYSMSCTEENYHEPVRGAFGTVVIGEDDDPKDPNLASDIAASEDGTGVRVSARSAGITVESFEFSEGEAPQRGATLSQPNSRSVSATDISQDDHIVITYIDQEFKVVTARVESNGDGPIVKDRLWVWPHFEGATVDEARIESAGSAGPPCPRDDDGCDDFAAVVAQASKTVGEVVDSDIILHLLTPGGLPIGTTILVNQSREGVHTDPDLAVAQTGNTAVTYVRSLDGKTDVLVMLFDANGTPVGQETVVATDVGTDSPIPKVRFSPVGDPSGLLQFMITWIQDNVVNYKTYSISGVSAPNPPALPEQFVWTGDAGDTNWRNPSNWKDAEGKVRARAPGPDDEVIIENATVANAVGSVRFLYLRKATVSVNQGDTLSCGSETDGQSTSRRGVTVGDGSKLTVEGTLSVVGLASLNVTEGSELVVAATGTVSGVSSKAGVPGSSFPLITINGTVNQSGVISIPDGPTDTIAFQGSGKLVVPDGAAAQLEPLPPTLNAEVMRSATLLLIDPNETRNEVSFSGDVVVHPGSQVDLKNANNVSTTIATLNGSVTLMGDSKFADNFKSGVQILGNRGALNLVGAALTGDAGAGITCNSGGRLTVDQASSVTIGGTSSINLIEGGKLENAGRVQVGEINNAGELSAGGTGASVDKYTQEESGVLRTTAEPDAPERITVSGEAALAGKLVIKVAAEVLAELQGTFPIIGAESISGKFSAEEFDPQDDGFEISYTNTGVEAGFSVNSPSYEERIKQFFTEEQLNDEKVSGPMADPDKDGVLNVFELGTGGNPVGATGNPVNATPTADRNLLKFSFIRLENFPEFRIEFEFSPNLQGDNWRQDVGEKTVESLGNGFELVTICIPGTFGFGRLTAQAR